MDRGPLTEREREQLVQDVGTALTSLRLAHFRNYTDLFLHLEPGFTVLHGANAQGKTNLLEAIYLLATTRLLRTSRDAEAIQEGFDRSEVLGETNNPEASLKVVLEQGVRKRASLNGMNLPRASDLMGRIPAICVSITDATVVRGEPTDRRTFLDVELSQLYPNYLKHLAIYKRALEHRNALLRESKIEPQPAASFEVWEEPLALSGLELRTMRRRYVDRLAPHASARQQEFAERESLQLAYDDRDEAEDTDALLKSLQSKRSQDIARGHTSIGPHRDDLQILIDGKAIKAFGSQGQQRSALLAIKMATLTVSAEVSGRTPLLLLDDVLSDLDAERRSKLVEMVLRVAHQAVLTCTEPSALGLELLERAQCVKIVGGEIVTS